MSDTANYPNATVPAASGGGAVSVADGADVALGTTTDSAATTDTGTFSLISLFKRLLSKLTTLLNGGLPAALGQGTMAQSLRVVLASDQSSLPITQAAGTTGGTTPFRNTALTNTAVAVKASAGSLYGLHVQNPNTSAVFVQLYDLAQGSVSVGTTTPVQSYWLPASGAIDKDIPVGIAFAAAITIAATTTATGGTAPSTALVANALYK